MSKGGSFPHPSLLLRIRMTSWKENDTCSLSPQRLSSSDMFSSLVCFGALGKGKALYSQCLLLPNRNETFGTQYGNSHPLGATQAMCTKIVWLLKHVTLHHFTLLCQYSTPLCSIRFATDFTLNLGDMPISRKLHVPPGGENQNRWSIYTYSSFKIIYPKHYSRQLFNSNKYNTYPLKAA